MAYETGVHYPRSGIPEYLRQVLKPLVDAVLAGRNVSGSAGHHEPAFTGLTLADVNYIALCYAHPARCLTGYGVPNLLPGDVVV